MPKLESFLKRIQSRYDLDPRIINKENLPDIIFELFDEYKGSVYPYRNYEDMIEQLSDDIDTALFFIRRYWK